MAEYDNYCHKCGKNWGHEPWCGGSKEEWYLKQFKEVYGPSPLNLTVECKKC